MSSEPSSARTATDADRMTLKYFENGGAKPPISKVELVGSTDEQPGCTTFAIWYEDHTLANSLRHLIIQDETVEFCGYSIPHPSESKVHIRIQTKDGSPAINVLNRGLDNLIDVAEHVITCFEQELANGDYIKDSDAEF